MRMQNYRLPNPSLIPKIYDSSTVHPYETPFSDNPKPSLYLIFHANPLDQLESSTISGAGSNNKAQIYPIPLVIPDRATVLAFQRRSRPSTCQGLRLMSLIFKTQSAKGCVNVTRGSVSEATLLSVRVADVVVHQGREKPGIEARGSSCHRPKPSIRADNQKG